MKMNKSELLEVLESSRRHPNPLFETYNNMIDILKNDPDKNIKIIPNTFIYDAEIHRKRLLEHLHHQCEQKEAFESILERQWWCIDNFILQGICKSIDDYHDKMGVLNRKLNDLQQELNQFKSEVNHQT